MRKTNILIVRDITAIFVPSLANAALHGNTFYTRVESPHCNTSFRKNKPLNSRW